MGNPSESLCLMAFSTKQLIRASKFVGYICFATQSNNTKANNMAKKALIFFLV